MEIKVLQLHKKASIEYKNIQDKYNYSISNKCVALSDGTTQSFKSELWAKMVVDNFVKDPLFDVNLLKEKFKKIATEFENTDFEFSSNFAKASLEKAKKNKGGTATFIGLQFINDSLVKVLNCGDTCLFVLRDNKINSFPFKTLEELDNNNYFINSNKLLEDEIENDFFNFNEITILKDDIFILATDAISRLILRKPESISLILKCNNFEDLKSFCETGWESKELEEDDISLIIITPIAPDKIAEIIPPNDFSFPAIIENEFIPSLGNQNFTNNVDNLKMEELNRMMQQLFRETAYLKNKLKLTHVMLISAIAILIINTLLLFYFIDKKNSIPPEVENINDVSTQYEEDEPTEKVETVNEEMGKEQNFKITDTKVEEENAKAKKVEARKETTNSNPHTEIKTTNTKSEIGTSKSTLEDNKKNTLIKGETKKDSIKS